MAKRFQFKPDDDGIVRVTNSAEIGRVLTAAAQTAAAQVRKLGPTKRRSFFDWKSNVKAIPATRGIDGKLRSAVEVDSPGWHLPEYGTAEIAATAPLRRGVMLAGIELVDGGLA